MTETNPIEWVVKQQVRYTVTTSVQSNLIDILLFVYNQGFHLSSKVHYTDKTYYSLLLQGH